jgi:hypothetical protein
MTSTILIALGIVAVLIVGAAIRGFVTGKTID